MRPVHAQRTLRRGEAGNTLLVAMVFGMIAGMLLVTYLTLLENQNRSSLRYQAFEQALVTADAGVEEALSHLRRNPGQREADGWVTATNCVLKQRDLGEGHYVVCISNVTPPVIFSHGYARVPTSEGYLPPRTIRVDTRPRPMFPAALTALGQVELYGCNLRTDSFDSGDPRASTEGRFDPGKSRDHGDLLTNGTLTNSLGRGSLLARGKLTTGPSGSMNVGRRGTVGSRTWVEGGNQGVQRGAFRNDANLELPPVETPYTQGAVPRKGVVNGVSYVQVLGTGRYLLRSLDLSGTNRILVNGHAMLLVQETLSLGGEAVVEIRTNASLRVYASGNRVVLGGMGFLNQAGNATNLIIHALPAHGTLSLSAAYPFVGLIYAPTFDLELGGAGNNEYDLVGAIVADRVRLRGNYRVHYDESLRRNGPSFGYMKAFWREFRPES